MPAWLPEYIMCLEIYVPKFKCIDYPDWKMHDFDITNLPKCFRLKYNDKIFICIIFDKDSL